MARKVSKKEQEAWERKQRVAGMVRTGEMTKEDYEQARNEWLAARAEAVKKSRNK